MRRAKVLYNCADMNTLNDLRLHLLTHKLLLGTVMLCNTAAVCAQPGERTSPAFISIVSDNDNYVPPRDDRHYSNGLRVAYGFAEEAHSPWRDWLGKLSLLDEHSGQQEYDIALGQNIYTPTNFGLPTAINDDRPYAGWLYAELAVTTHLPGAEEYLSVNLGVVGPLALGRQAQTLIHNIFGGIEPRGWNHQLDNEPALLLHYRRSWFTPVYGSAEFNVDFVARAGLSLGNVVTETGFGGSLRAGSFLPERELPQRIQPGLSGTAARFEARKGRTDWMLYASAQGRGVAHNIFLDGNTWQESLSVDKRAWVADLSLGLMLTFGQISSPISVSFTHTWRGREFEQQKDIDKFGSVQVSLQY